MKDSYDYDIIDGKSVPPIVITNDHIIRDTHRGTVHVEAGTLQLDGVIQGTLDVQSDAQVIISGKQKGTVSVAARATVRVKGAIEGTTTIHQGGCIIIEDSGKLAGTLANDGIFILRGVFGGARSGDGDFRIEGNGYIKKPVIRDGVYYYEW